MPRIALRDYKVHFQQTGAGPDIVLIHGLSCHIAFWWFQVAPHLAQTHRVTALDLRGHGFSGMTETGYRACDLAGDLAVLLEHLGITRAHLLAHSFGGAVAAALATERGDLVSELTLADAWLPSLQPVPPLPGARDWAATRARAHARGIDVDPQLPLVVRGLYAELLDETEFQDEVGGAVLPAAEAAVWEDVSGEIGAGPMGGAGAGWRGSRLGRSLWPGAGPWRGRGGRFFGAAGRFAPGRRDAVPDAAPAPSAAAAADDTDGSRRQALEGALAMTGAPGQPSQAVRRWKELMMRTHARSEFLDTTAIEPPALRDIRAPVRLIYGTRSHYRPTAEALQALLPQAGLRLVPRAGHFYPLLRPQALLQAMEEPADAGAGRPARGRKAWPRLRLVASRAGASEPDDQADELAPPVRPSSGAPRA